MPEGELLCWEGRGADTGGDDGHARKEDEEVAMRLAHRAALAVGAKKAAGAAAG